LSVAASTEIAPLVELERVSKDYDAGGNVVRAMREVSLSVRPGEFVAIVGASGSGKSTMMNIVGCLDRPTSGTYKLAGIDVGRRAPDSRAIVRNRVIGFIFQGFNLLPRTTALENVELPLQYRGVGLRERRRRARAALSSVGLGDRLSHTPQQLSGGQQQRVAIARALVTDPPLLLADEPTGNLDTRTSLEVLALLQRLNRERGLTIVLVTHERDIAACASRVVTMRDGRVVSDVAQPNPLQADSELARLPGVDETPAPGHYGESILGRAHRQLPLRVYAVMLAAEWVATSMTAAAGLALHLGLARVLVLAIAAGHVAKAYAGSRWARRALARFMTHDERVTVAFWYTTAITCGLGGLLSAAALRISLRAPSELAGGLAALEALASHRQWVILAAVSLGTAGAGLFLYLLLSLFGSSRALAASRSQ
jgi:putative ABC transport system ATP-binding protein